VLVGVVGLNLQRSDFYEKEITFQVSCSYGPGRYDPDYELKGQDYPPGFVRWTEQRNFQAMLEAMAAKQIDVNKLITHRFPFKDAAEAYRLITGKSDSLGVILEYPKEQQVQRTIKFAPTQKCSPTKPVVAVLGSGNFSKMTMVPALTKTEARLKYITARTNGAVAAHIAKKFGFEHATTALDEVWADKEVNTVFISTNHNSHAAFLKRALESGKHAFVEKPLCLKLQEMKEINKTIQTQTTSENAPQIMVGFNRRFSAHTVKIKELLKGRSEPLAMNMLANAGMIPADHWVQDPAVGGGRIIGEACHFIDLLQFITDSEVISVSCNFLQKSSGNTYDTAVIVLAFADGSTATVNYFANGSKSYPKETLQIFSEGRILELDNFKNLTGYGFKGFTKYNTWSQDKGHETQFAKYIEQIEKGEKPLISYKEIVNSTLASFAAVTSGNEGRLINIAKEYDGILKS
jgi:predicted dehydrogenase